MTSIIPDEGLDWYRNKGIEDNDVTDEFVYDVAVGDGDQTVSSTDTQLNNEVYRANDDEPNASIDDANSTGKYLVEISVTGGTEVPGGTTITELGVWARDPSMNQSNVDDGDDKMIYHEGFNGKTVNNGETKTFTIELTITNT